MEETEEGLALKILIGEEILKKITQPRVKAAIIVENLVTMPEIVALLKKKKGELALTTLETNLVQSTMLIITLTMRVKMTTILNMRMKLKFMFLAPDLEESSNLTPI